MHIEGKVQGEYVTDGEPWSTLRGQTQEVIIFELRPEA